MLYDDMHSANHNLLPDMHRVCQVLVMTFLLFKIPRYNNLLCEVYPNAAWIIIQTELRTPRRSEE